MNGQPGHNKRPLARLPTSFLGMDAWRTLQMVGEWYIPGHCDPTVPAVRCSQSHPRQVEALWLARVNARDLSNCTRLLFWRPVVILAASRHRQSTYLGLLAQHTSRSASPLYSVQTTPVYVLQAVNLQISRPAHPLFCFVLLCVFCFCFFVFTCRTRGN